MVTRANGTTAYHTALLCLAWAMEAGMMDAHPQLLQERRNFFVKLQQPPVSAGEEILVDYRGQPTQIAVRIWRKRESTERRRLYENEADN